MTVLTKSAEEMKGSDKNFPGERVRGQALDLLICQELFGLFHS